MDGRPASGWRLGDIQMDNGQLKISTLVTAAVVTTILVSSAAQAQIRYVDDDAALGGDGLAWNTAYQLLQDALAEASGNPAINEIRVAQGTYKPDQDEGGNVTPGDRADTFQLIDGVALRGGYRGPFDGTGLPPDDRDIELFETILSGNIAAAASSLDNSYHVVTSNGVNESAVLDGFTITAGNADGVADAFFGGGVFNDDGSPVLKNCTLSDNSGGGGGGMYSRDGNPAIFGSKFSSNAAIFGGGMRNDGGFLMLINCTFISNVAGFGGGLYNEGTNAQMVIDCTFIANSAAGGGGLWNQTSSPTIVNSTFEGNIGGGMRNRANSNAEVIECTFTGNTAALGGGMYNEASSPLVVNCVFEGNSAGTGDCKGFSGRGGGMYNGSGSAAVSDCTFRDNTACYAGGGMYNAQNAPTDTPTVVNCTFRGNDARFAGAMFNVQNGLTIINCTFSGNNAEADAGGMYNYLSSATVTNCMFSGNSAGGEGGGMFNYGIGPAVANCTFGRNTAGDEGGAIYNRSGSHTVVTNCILWENTPDHIFDTPDGTFSTVRYSDVQGGWSGDGSNNIDADPLFVDPVNGDLRLSLGSPCIDAADNTAVPSDEFDLDDDGDTDEPVPFDLDGNSRFVDDPGTVDTGNPGPPGPIVDMGAYEFQLPCPWDLNGDGEVNVLDLIELVMSFGPCEDCPADFDDDGFVGVLDLITLLMNLGPCPGTECIWDVNGDGVVDQSDVQAVASNLGPCEDPENCPWDVNSDGVVNGQDVAAVGTHFGPCS